MDCVYAILLLCTDEDYHMENTTVYVPDGVISQSFIINITDDEILECNETFIVTIRNFSICGFIIGRVDTTGVVIFADGGKQYIFHTKIQLLHIIINVDMYDYYI